MHFHDPVSPTVPCMKVPQRTPIILPNPHPEADSAALDTHVVSRAGGSLRSISDGCSPVTPPPLPLAMRLTGCACVHMCTHAGVCIPVSSVLGRGSSNWEGSPGSVCLSGFLQRCLQSWFSWGWVLFPTLCWEEGVTSLYH